MIKRLSEPADYCLVGTAPEYRLSQFERLTLVGGEELSRAISWITKQLESFSYSRAISQVDFDWLRKRAKPYTTPGLRENPATFFRHPSGHPKVREVPVHGLKDGQVVDLEFESDYPVFQESLAAEFHGHSANRTTHARMWRHQKGAAATLIALHGWTMGDQRINSLAFLPGFFYQAGLDVVLMELPFHGRRQAKSKLGAYDSFFPNADIALTNEAMGQIIWDLRRLHSHLKQQGSPQVGCMGMSLGGYCAALWAGLDRLDFCIPIVPLVSMADLVWKVMTEKWGRDSLKVEHLSPRFLREAYYVHTPLHHQVKIDPEKLLLIAGRADKMVPSRQARLLWEHWDKPLLLRLKGGHAAQLGGMRAFDEILSFFQRAGYLANQSQSSG